MSISASALLGYYQAQAGINPSSSSTSGSSSSTSSSSSSSTSSTTYPTPPWTTRTTSQKTNKAVETALSGGSLFNPQSVKVSVPNASPNYKNLFALYQGITSLEDLANQAATSGETSSQIQQLQDALTNGLKQLQTYLGTSPFQGFSVAQGAVQTQEQSTAGVAGENYTYTTGNLATSASTAVPAFEGDVQFSLTVTLPAGNQKVVDFNLADMGSETRSLSNVVNYMNAQMQAAGLATNFSIKLTQGEPTTTKVNGQTYTLPAGPNQYALQVNGNSVENLSLSSASSSPAVYLTQTVGTTTGTTPDAEQQLVGLTTDPSASSDQLFSDTMNSVVQSAIATATAPDGSVYVLANVNGSTPAGESGSAQSILGTQDVALLKYDSAGNLLSSQVVGSSGSASGYGLTVSPDGSEVAVTGTATSLTTSSGTSSSTTSTGFVSVYSSAGQPLWTNTLANGNAGQVNQVAFGADNSVYVAGTDSLSGSTTANNYIAGFSSSGVQKFMTSLGPTTQGTISGLAVSGDQLITAGVQNGDAVVQSYQLQSSGSPTLTATRDLGALDGGNVAGVAVNADGSIIVAGSTHNGALSAGTITNAYSGGEEAFVANLSADLTPSSSDSLAYYAGSGGDLRVTAVTAAGGQAYIAGQVATGANSSGAATSQGFAAQIDPQTGVSGWSDQYSGLDSKVAPNSIAVAATGASALNALGLPTGALDFSPVQTITANSSVVAGDQFTIATNYSSTPQTITISSTDTLQTLATKISQATGYQANATVATGEGGVQELNITTNFPGVKITLGAGPAGANALPALGLTEGVITSNAFAKAAKKGAATTAATANSLMANYALNIPSTLDLTTSAGVKQAQSVLSAAASTIKGIYSNMVTPPSTSSSHASSGSAPAYLTSEIASYQNALVRLTGGSSSSSSSTALAAL
jgi:hypothetical protein